MGCCCETVRIVATVCSHTQARTVLCPEPTANCCRSHKFDMRIGWCDMCEAYYGSDLARKEASIRNYWLYKARHNFRTPIAPQLVPLDALVDPAFDGVVDEPPTMPLPECDAFSFSLRNLMTKTADGRQATKTATGQVDRDDPGNVGGYDEGIAWRSFDRLVNSTMTVRTITILWARANVTREVDLDKMQEEAEEEADIADEAALRNPDLFANFDFNAGSEADQTADTTELLSVVEAGETAAFPSTVPEPLPQRETVKRNSDVQKRAISRYSWPARLESFPPYSDNDYRRNRPLAAATVSLVARTRSLFCLPFRKSSSPGTSASEVHPAMRRRSSGFGSIIGMLRSLPPTSERLLASGRDRTDSLSSISPLPTPLLGVTSSHS